MQQIPQHLIEEELERRRNEKEFEKCKNNKWYWLTTYVRTLDEVDTKNPIKKFPKNKEYIKELIKVWEGEKLILIEKSRRMMMTWLCVALCLHEAQFNDGKSIFFQSKKEDDADALIGKSKFIYNHQPEFLKQKIDEKFKTIRFPDRNSQIIGIPQGGDQIRMYTASRIFSDEMAFQPEAEDAFTASRPCIEGGGAFIGVSTANPGFFHELCKEGGEYQEITHGMSQKHTPTGFCVIRLHYTADEKKRTPEWLKEAKRGFIHEDKWKKEYEIDYTALGGTAVYPELTKEKVGEMFINPFHIKKHWNIYAGIDPGVRNPTSAHLYAIDENGNVYVYWELYEKELHYKDLARTLKEHPDFERFKRNIFIDPITATKVHQVSFGIKSFKELLEDEGVYTNPGNRNRLDGAEKIREYIVDNRLIIFKTCPEILKELQNLRYEEWNDSTKPMKNIKEEIVAKNDHAWSEMRYTLMGNPLRAKKPMGDLEARMKKQLQTQRGSFGDFYRIK